LTTEELTTAQTGVTFMGRVKDYSEFLKLRLASLVVLSSVICYGLAATEFSIYTMAALIVGGTLLTGASNGFNEIIERDLDALMDRTKSRPLPTSKMTVPEAWIIASIFGVGGITTLGFLINPMCGILGFLALILYVLVYTPMKQKTPFAVFVGAFPGSIPPMLGCVAATDGFGEITHLALIMFAVQFIWQFPHFWAIAWRMHDDYLKAGFKMLPSLGGRNKACLSDCSLHYRPDSRQFSAFVFWIYRHFFGCNCNNCGTHFYQAGLQSL
jgi:protoheme IX farnesyltransferase